MENRTPPWIPRQSAGTDGLAPAHLVADLLAHPIQRHSLSSLLHRLEGDRPLGEANQTTTSRHGKTFWEQRRCGVCLDKDVECRTFYMHIFRILHICAIYENILYINIIYIYIILYILYIILNYIITYYISYYIILYYNILYIILYYIIL